MFSTFLNETTKESSEEYTYTSKSKISVPLQKIMAVSTPITIPKQSERVQSTEYELNLNFFNPSKMSPPDCWKSRLEQRIRNLDDSDFNKNKSDNF